MFALITKKQKFWIAVAIVIGLLDVAAKIGPAGGASGSWLQ